MSLVNVIDSIVITQESDKTKILAEWSKVDPDITTYGQMISGQAVKLFVNWSDGNGSKTLHPGDYFTFVVPEVFRHDKISIIDDADIYAISGEVVANYSIYDNANNLKEVKITVTDYVETHSDISGDFWLLLFVGAFETSEIQPIEFVINGGVAASGGISITPPTGSNTPHNEKYGHSALNDIYNGYYIFNWVIRLNMEKDPVNGFQVLDNFRFEDRIPDDSPHVFLTDEIRQQLGLSEDDFPLRIGEYHAADSYPPQDRYELLYSQYNSSIDFFSNDIFYVSFVNDYSRDGIDGGEGLKVSNLIVSEKSISAELGKLTRPTSIQYCTLATIKIAQSALGDSEVVKQFKNIFEANYGEVIDVSLQKKYFGSGGTADGIVGDYSFSFNKVNEKDTPLAGVLFSLYISEDFSVGADRIAYSDVNGVVTFKNLPEQIYYVLETETPSGYSPNTMIYRVDLEKDKYEIYYGENYQYRLSDNGNKVVNKLQTPFAPVVLGGTKKLVGKKLTDGMFSFVVKDASGTTVATGKNNANGSIKFSEIDFSVLGEYTFTIEEVRGGYSGITYDSTKFTVTVLITDDGYGNLISETIYPYGGVNFSNRYSQKNKCKCLCPTRSTKCRKAIKGSKIWLDNDNANKSRPSTIEIKLLRDGVFYKSIILDTEIDDEFIFCCLPIWDNLGHEYNYQLEETVVEGYTTTIDGNDIINTLA